MPVERGQTSYKTPISKIFASPTLTGTPKAPTAGVSTDNTQIATTAFANRAANNAANNAVSTIGIVQDTNTATQNITAGQYVIWHGALYTASAAIASGATLSSSNLTVVTGGGLNNLLALFYQTLNNNAGAHNCIYRGRYLGSSVTAEQYEAISAGTFEDLYIGDYWTIGGVNYRIADFDYFYRSGDTECKTHHVVIVPDTNLDNKKMNDTNVTTGGYTGSKMYTDYMATAKNKIIAAFGSGHILNHREYLTNAVANGRPSGGAWFDSTIELMSEAMCYGGTFFEPVSDGSTVPAKYSVACKQLNLFRHRPDMISNRQWFWLRNVVSVTGFASVSDNGTASVSSASYSSGVRPAFGIKA